METHIKGVGCYYIMPKVEIDYSNTIIYKISCKDNNVTDLYVGHTTNFVQRKHAHKQGCNNAKSANYSCKLYNTIRQHGGWSNWTMEIIAFYNCVDLSDARKKEQEHFILLNATLNSIEPFPEPKCVPTLNINPEMIKSKHFCETCKFSCFNTLDIFNAHFNNTKHIKSASRLAETITRHKTYYCEKCDYICSNKTNYVKHLQTTKHNVQRCSEIAQPIVAKYECVCGNSYKHVQSYNRHKSSCSVFNGETPQPEPPQQPSTQVDISVVLELLKQNQEFKDLLIEQNKQMLILAQKAGNHNNINTNCNNNNKSITEAE